MPSFGGTLTLAGEERVLVVGIIVVDTWRQSGISGSLHCDAETFARWTQAQKNALLETDRGLAISVIHAWGNPSSVQFESIGSPIKGDIGLIQ
jgi:hypothetical protein